MGVARVDKQNDVTMEILLPVETKIITFNWMSGGGHKPLGCRGKYDTAVITSTLMSSLKYLIVIGHYLTN